MLYTTDFAEYLKKKRLLWWLVTHQDDIAKANFLQGANVTSFRELADYDILELRAVYAAIPATFQLDTTPGREGQKAAWREHKKLCQPAATAGMHPAVAAVWAGWVTWRTSSVFLVRPFLDCREFFSGRFFSIFLSSLSMGNCDLSGISSPRFASPLSFPEARDELLFVCCIEGLCFFLRYSTSLYFREISSFMKDICPDISAISPLICLLIYLF